ncbi:hypothetical protein CROQUDRAFT_88549 [Cronartium quercuum f. sp. fusiforme G11]|uniref:Uncharacterized protein n=1 Tax=Cronartium quercuum f. sp. fusiforme G11 TaxID=708437 RepID=A0A9P6TFI9_9BASI|nr:hypothetical protein CROQUDRAFT_88549 [Cronartium quercuum f. sp. fusiforme G11]
MSRTKFQYRTTSLDPPHYEEARAPEPTIALNDTSISYHLIPDAEDAEDIVDPVLSHQNWYRLHQKDRIVPLAANLQYLSLKRVNASFLARSCSQSDFGDVPSRGAMQQNWENRILPSYHENMNWEGFAPEPLRHLRDMTNCNGPTSSKDQYGMLSLSQLNLSTAIVEMPHTPEPLQHPNLTGFGGIARDWDGADGVATSSSKSMREGHPSPQKQLRYILAHFRCKAS